jgi:cell division protein FtsI (penicillin-binding protein 3)
MKGSGIEWQSGRRNFVTGLFILVAAVLIWRVAYLQWTQKDFLQDRGDARYLRTVSTPSHRGVISDRNGEPLAISTQVSSVWAVPRQVQAEPRRWPELAKVLGMKVSELKELVGSHSNSEFVYLKRQVRPNVAAEVTDLHIPGVSLQNEYRRYYPASEVTAHLLGFTDVDDKGQEGVELAYDEHLRGVSGAKRVIKDRLGRVVENVESIRETTPGRDLTLSIDKRLQYVANRELKNALQAHKARAGSVVILDARNGEVLAMANQPSYNPNNRRGLTGEFTRNRAITDVFEPGSTIKPFTIAAALEAKICEPSTRIDTRPGFMHVRNHTIRDHNNYGILDVTGIIKKSSNVGTTKIALAMEPQLLWRMFARLGFGAITDTGFPGEVPGQLKDYRSWREMDRVTMAFGYGISMTTLQLAQAYMAFATDGVWQPLTLEKGADAPEGRRVMGVETAKQVRAMLEEVVRGGTGRQAGVSGYRVAGKTGTAHKTAGRGYEEDHYRALFAGILPGSQPRLVAAVMIDDPTNGKYYGGEVAAPVFAAIMRDAVRLLDIPPDDISKLTPNALVAETPSGD